MKILMILASGLAASTAPLAVAAQPAQTPVGVSSQQKADLYSRLLLESRDIAMDMVDTIGAMGAAQPGEAFDASWTGPMKARAAALKGRIDAAPALDPAEFTAGFSAADPRRAEVSALLGAFPGVLRETHAVAQSLVDKTADLGPKAHGGDEQASLALAGAMFDGMRAATAAENLQLQLASSGFDVAHPERALTASSVASNKAMIEFFGVMSGQAAGRDVNLVSAARRIRGFAIEGRDAAETVPELVSAMTDAPLSNGQRAALDSYRSSASNELAISERIGAMAVSLAEDGLTEGVEQAWADIEALIDRRFQLDRARRLNLSQ